MKSRNCDWGFLTQAICRTIFVRTATVGSLGWNAPLDNAEKASARPGTAAAVLYAALFREAFFATDFLAASCAALIAAQRRFVPVMIALRPAAESFRFLLGGSAEID